MIWSAQLMDTHQHKRLPLNTKDVTSWHNQSYYASRIEKYMHALSVGIVRTSIRGFVSILAPFRGMRVSNARRNNLYMQWDSLRHWTFCFLLFSSLPYITPCEMSRYFLKKSSANSSNLTYSAPSLYAADMPLTQASSCMFYVCQYIFNRRVGPWFVKVMRCLLGDLRDKFRREVLPLPSSWVKNTGSIGFENS